MVGVVSGGSVFPRIRAGASLKLFRANCNNQRRCVFPRIRAGASLKQRDVGGEPRIAARFPPHSCGGLIEAWRNSMLRCAKNEFSPAFVRGPH